MPSYIGNAIVLIVLGLIVFLACKSMYNKHKHSGGCSGNCATCGGSDQCHVIKIELPEDFDSAVSQK